MKIKTFNNNPMGQNNYLYYCEARGEGVLIDAGCSPEDMASFGAFIRENTITVKAVLITHGHYDHITAAHAAKSLTGAPLYCHEAEKDMLENPALNLSPAFGASFSVVPDAVLTDTFPVADATLHVLHTPGHTPGGVCFYDEKNAFVFTGDTLFANAIGRTDLPRGSHALLIKNINEILFTLPEATTVYPGHGACTTIGKEQQRGMLY